VLINRAEIIREKGTNRSSYFRGEVDKYGWVDIGSSFLPSDIVSAYLFAQLENLDAIQTRRKALWQRYWEALSPELFRYGVSLPQIPDYATNNAHMFYLVCPNLAVRTRLIDRLKARGVLAVFHYQSLHNSAYFLEKHSGRLLPNSDRFSNCLLRLPMFYELTDAQCDYICSQVLEILRDA
jgi:dTDP-4-amino-4,6-dideoxygalactose transaminase